MSEYPWVTTGRSILGTEHLKLTLRVDERNRWTDFEGVCGTPKRTLQEMQVPVAPCAGAESAVPVVESASSAENSDSEPLVQYVVLRKDLQTELQWPLGAVVAQACHAAVAAMGAALEDNPVDAKRYLAEGSNMRTVVLQVSSEAELMRLRDKLSQSGIHHTLWQEEPEKVPTALASIPIKKSAGRAFKGLKLLS
ncbi:hypothetical protein Emed_000057 [Eimeria media]